MSTLFDAAGLADGTPHPLADRLRPKVLDDVLGQDHVLGEGGPLQRMLNSGRLPSLVFWGPPGTGKTTIARLLADRVGLDFVQLSAVFSGVADLRKAIDGARKRRQVGRGTLLFVDEIHRFNRAQQDGFLPVVEDGTIVLVGATTENPSFELNAALLSRCQVLVLTRLEDADLERLLERAEALVNNTLPLTADARAALRGMSDGDGRYLLNLAEDLFAVGGASLNTKALVKAVQKRAPIYDKSRDEHYNLISALHKSLRGSDANASLYWLARMLVWAANRRSTSCGASCDSLSRTLALRIPMLSIKRSRPRIHTISWDHRRGNWRLPKLSFISRPHPNQMQPTQRFRRQDNLRARRAHSHRPNTY
jgi:putative ATPase